MFIKKVFEINNLWDLIKVMTIIDEKNDKVFFCFKNNNIIYPDNYEDIPFKEEIERIILFKPIGEISK